MKKWTLDIPTKQIGSGSFAVVYAGQYDGKPAAIKSIHYSKYPPNSKKYLDQEIRVTQTAKHKNIVTLFAHEQIQNNIYLVFEYMNGGELKTLITTYKTGFPEDVCRKFMLDIVSGMRYIHSLGYAHRDLKPQNILLTEQSFNATLKICDFGMARELGEDVRGDLSCSYIGSPEYMSPEVLLHMPYNNKTDLWSIGSILYEMLTGASPCISLLSVPERSLQRWSEKINAIHKAGGRITNSLFRPSCSDMCWDLLKRILVTAPKDRSSWKQFFDHPYLSKVNLAMSTVGAPSSENLLVPITIFALTPQGKELTLFVPKPPKIKDILECVSWCASPLLLGVYGEELTQQTLEKYLDGASMYIYVVDTTNMTSEPYLLPPIIKIIDDRRKRLLENTSLRLKSVKKMWKSQHIQNRVGMVYYSHVISKKAVIADVHKKLPEWKALTQDKDYLHKLLALQAHLPTAKKSFGELILGDESLDGLFGEFEMLVEEMRCVKSTTEEINSPLLIAYESRNLVADKCDAATLFVCGLVNEVACGSDIFAMETKLCTWEKEQVAEKCAMSEKMFRCLSAFPRNSILNFTEKVQRIEYLAQKLASIKPQFHKYCLMLQELNAQFAFANHLNSHIMQMNTELVHMVRMEEERRANAYKQFEDCIERIPEITKRLQLDTPQVVFLER